MNIKDQIKKHYEKSSLSNDKIQQLHHQLDNNSEAINSDPAESNHSSSNVVVNENEVQVDEKSLPSAIQSNNLFLKLHNFGVFYAIAAVVILGLGFVLLQNKNKFGYNNTQPQDILNTNDLTKNFGMPPESIGRFPPDFDLEGNAEVLSLFTKPHDLDVNFPVELDGKYQPNQGRFFYWDERPAVAISLEEPSNQSDVNKNTPTPVFNNKQKKKKVLYIVKPKPENLSQFPSVVPQQHVIPQVGTEVWRSGDTGYILTNGE